MKRGTSLNALSEGQSAPFHHHVSTNSPPALPRWPYRFLSCGWVATVSSECKPYSRRNITPNRFPFQSQRIMGCLFFWAPSPCKILATVQVLYWIFMIWKLKELWQEPSSAREPKTTRKERKEPVNWLTDKTGRREKEMVRYKSHSKHGRIGN